MRRLQVLAVFYLLIAVCGAFVWRARSQTPPPAPAADPVAAIAVGAQAQDWFNAVRDRCNAQGVEALMVQTPAPTGDEGAGYAATCWAMAGHIDAARASMYSMSSDRHQWAAGLMFGAIHPDADSGREAEVAPAMELVLEFTPHNVMALYHAGSAAYSEGRTEATRKYLESFVDVYGPDDGWKSNARLMLANLEG